MTGIKRKTISIITAVAFAMGALGVPNLSQSAFADENSSFEGDYVEGQVIVGYIDSENVEMTESQEAKAEKTLGESEELAVCDMDTEKVDVDENVLTDDAAAVETVDERVALVESRTKSTEELIDEISRLPNVDYVEPNYLFTVDGSEDYTGSQWAFNGTNGINVPDWNEPDKENAEDTVVAVIDSGVDYQHEDLRNIMWNDGLEYPSLRKLGGGKYGIDIVNDDDDPMAEYPHGTHCAGIIAAEWNGMGVSGGANGAEIMAVKATYRQEGQTKDTLSLSNVIKSFNYVIEAKKNGVNVVAINASWGGVVSGLSDNVRSIRNLVEYAGNDCDIVTVFASCNEGANTDVKQNGGYYLTYYMKDSPYKLVVNSNTKGGQRASSSNYGYKTTDVFAPGESIISTVLDDEYDSMSGTSMAAPAVSAAVAVVAAQQPKATAEQIVEIIKDSVTKVSSFSNMCESGGIVNVEEALSISERNIELYDFELSQSSFVYDGQYRKPEVICDELTEGVDYEVKYTGSDRNCILPGKYKAVISGKGNCFGEVILSYRIAVQPAAISKLSSGARSFTVKAEQQSAELVTGYQVRYSLYSSMKNHKTKTIGTKSSAVTKKITNLKKNRKYYVQVRTYKTIEGKKYYSIWSSKKTVKTR